MTSCERCASISRAWGREGSREARRHGGTEARRHGGTEARRHGGGEGVEGEESEDTRERGRIGACSIAVDCCALCMQFKADEVQIVVATDVASRGLDVKVS
jgi:hypothetical protein